MDSQARILNCMRVAIRDAGLSPPADGRITEIIGLGLLEAVQSLLPGAPPALVEQVMERYRYHFLVEDRTASTLFEGAVEMIESLLDRGYLLAVATGKGRGGLDRALEQTGLDGHFHATRCADESRSKPSPDMLYEIMEELGVAEARTLMVGDTEYDLQMAANAGVSALAVSYGVHDKQRLLSHSPLGCANDVREIPEWIEVGAGISAVSEL